MKAVGFLLLVSGWGLVLAALGMLSAAGPRGAFVAAGVAVEILGLVMTVRAHMPPPPKKNNRARDLEPEDDLGGGGEALR
jgi:hypothetical protein